MGVLNYWRQDKIKIGFFLGMILSLVIFLTIIIYHSLKIHTPAYKIRLLLTLRPSIITILAITIIIFNTCLLAWFNYNQEYEKSKGIFLITLITGISVFLLKLYILFFQF